MMTKRNSLVAVLLSGGLLVLPGITLGGQDPQPTEGDVLEKMEEVNAQYSKLLEKMDSIERRRRKLATLMAQADDADSKRSGQRSEDRQPPRPDAGEPARSAARDSSRADAGARQHSGTVATVQPAPRPVEVATDRREELEAQANRIPELPRVSDDVGGVLSPKGRLTLEPSFGYSYSSVNRIAIEGFTILPALLVGVIDVVEADRDSYSARLSGRYGITNRLEAEVSSSWVYRDDATRSREFLTGSVGDDIFKAQGSGLGDVEFGLRYQFKRRKPTSPFLVGNLRVKSDTGTDPFEIASTAGLEGQPKFSSELPTGSGFWSVNPSLTFIYPSDPVVFFGNLGYLWTLEDDKGTSFDAEGNVTGFGRVDPGDAFRASFGLGLGLNESSSLSISYALDQFTKTRIETAVDPEIAGSDVTIGKLVIGYSLRTPGGTPWNLAFGIGTTEDAPDTDITFRMPFGFGD